MVKVSLLGREFDIAPYKLGDMRRAAPIVDRMNGAAGSLSTLEGGVEFAGELAAFVAIGLSRIDPTLTVEALEDQLGMDNVRELQVAFQAILRASGLTPGEAKAPSASAEQDGASPSSSPPSSSTSSPQA